MRQHKSHACTYTFGNQAMKGHGSMPATLRLTASEQELLRKKCIEINRLLVKKGLSPIRDSELAHFLLEKSVTYVELDESGVLRLDCTE